MRQLTWTTAELVASAFDLGTPRSSPTYADRGELGRIWRLDTDRGSWALKELDQPVSEVDAAADVAFQLAAAVAGIPLPRPVRRPGGVVLMAGDEAASAAAALRVYTWAELRRGVVVSGADLGGVAARLHAIQHPAGGPVNEWFAEPLGEDGWHELLRSAEQAGVWWSSTLASALPELVEADGLITPPDDARTITCHLDLNAENVRRGGDGGVVVLDWENSGPAEPVQELAAILADTATALSLADARAAHRAYREAGGTAVVGGPADFSLALAVQGHLLRFYGDRALRGEHVDDRQRAERRLQMMLGAPLTPRRISQLLNELAR